MPTPLGAIFDMDGVLVDSTEAHFVAWRGIGERIGTPCPREIFEQTFGMHNNQIIPLWLGDGLSPERIEELSRDKEALYREVAADSLEPLEGVVELIRALVADGFRLAVGSSAPAANAELVLRTLGITDEFHALSTGDEVSHGKPHPEVFLRAASKLELPPERCVVIEDAPQGIEAGLAAGCRVIAVSSTRPRDELGRAHLVVDSLAGLTPAGLRALIGTAS